MRLSTTLPLLFLAGCSLLNAPDRQRIIDDAGVDMRVVDTGEDMEIPPDVFDAGIDAGPDTGPTVENCSTPIDDDGDTLINCADFDCAGFAGCCENGEPSLINFGAGLSTWTPIGTPDATAERVVFPGETPSIYVNHRCFPMAQGAEFDFFIELDSGTTSDCEEDGERCTEFAAFYVTSVTEAEVGSRIVAELGLTIYGSGRAELYQGRDNVIETIRWATGLPTAAVRVTFRLTPDVDAGEGVLRAEVSVNSTSFDIESTFPQTDLIRECSDGISGLYFGVEGVGQRVRVLGRDAQKRPLQCTNPTQFERMRELPPLVATDADADADHVSLGWTGDWTAGDVTHPELVLQGSEWNLYGSTGSQQLDLSYLPTFRWTMGHSSSEDWDLPPGMSWGNNAADRYHEVAGQQPTVALDNNGDPVFVAVIDDELHFCEEGQEDCAGLEIRCPSLSNPSIVRTPSLNYLLFYQCTEGGEHVIRSQPLGSRVTGLMRPDSTVVLSSRDFGGLASNTIIDFDVLLDEKITTIDGTMTTEYIIRVWFVGEALGNVRTLLLATAALKITTGTLDDLDQEYRLIPYSGNPIATQNVLFRDPDPTLEGVTVERLSDPRSLIFLFGRRTERPQGRLYDLLPLGQTWGAL